MTELLKMVGIAHSRRGKIGITNFPDILLNSGEAICITGASGSGKSLLLKIGAGLISPTEGRLQCKTDSKSYVFIEDGLLQNYSVWDNLMLPLIFSKQQGAFEERAAKALELFQLTNIRNDIVGGLPEPPKRLLQYARAEVMQPKILFVEEPLKNLRSEQHADVKKWLQNYVQKNSGGCIFTSVQSEPWGFLQPKHIRLTGGGASFKTEINE